MNEADLLITAQRKVLEILDLVYSKADVSVSEPPVTNSHYKWVSFTRPRFLLGQRPVVTVILHYALSITTKEMVLNQIFVVVNDKTIMQETQTNIRDVYADLFRHVNVELSNSIPLSVSL